jgi:hypothetical protein
LSDWSDGKDDVSKTSIPTNMKKKPQDQRDWHERRIEAARQKQVASEPAKAGAHGRPVEGEATETKESRETFPKRTLKPGQAGLANEARAGLGTRADNADPSEMPENSPKEATSRSEPQATPHGYEEPRPEPREQPSDSRAHEEERSTGVSGQSSGG